MTNHIEKMARTISAHDGGGIMYKSAALATFDALIDAVPDLEWSKAGFSIGVMPRYRINPMQKQQNFRTLFFGGFVLNDFDTIEQAKNAANEHHRAQVRAIWEGK